jgi:hypothetical protein
MMRPIFDRNVERPEYASAWLKSMLKSRRFVQNRDRIVEFRRASKRAFESYVSRETLPFDQTDDANLAKNARYVSRETFCFSWDY